MRIPRRRQEFAWRRIALFACLLLGTATSYAAAAPPTDDRLDALLAKAEQQLAAGHVTAPRNDNAVDTWLQLLSLNLPDTPANMTAIQSFTSDLRRRATAAKAAENLTLSARYTVFAGMAEDYLAQANAAPRADSVSALPKPGPRTGDSAAAAETMPPQAAALEVTASRDPTAKPFAAGESSSEASPSSFVPAANVGTLQEAKASPTPPLVSPESVGDASARQTNPANIIAPAGRPAVDPKTSIAGAPGLVLLQDQAAVALYSARGDAMIAVKDVSAARRLYELAANAGSAHAALALGKTYDPAGLQQIGAIGLRPNPGLAALWYRRAETLGDPDAEARLNSLAYEAPR